MATITIKTPSGSDIVQFTEAVIDDFTLTFNPTTLTIVSDVTGDRITVKGTFEFPTPGSITGTVTSVTLTDNPGELSYASMTSISVDASLFADRLLNGTVEDVLGLLGDIKFVGNDGNDIGFGALGNDTLQGGGGDDKLSGFAGADVIEGGAGADEMHGGSGKDTLSYKGSASKVTVSLQGNASGGDAAGDTFDGFENLTGSAFNDKLTGTNNINVLNGGAGDDVIRGAGGADTLIGGTGTDTADYTGSRSGVTVNLGAGTGSGGHAAGDTLSSIENATGSKKNDSLTGSVAANALNGAAGNDRLDGGTGNDVLTGGLGSDTFVLSNLAASADDITDFEVGVDHLEVSTAVFGGGLDPLLGLSANQFEINDTGLATLNSTRFILNSTTGELHYDNNGAKDGGPGNRIIATLDGDLTLFSNSDILIV